MAIKLSANYSKKLGLPQYSSHSFSASVEVELSDITQVEAEVQKLYQLLQHSVDQEIQHPGYVPTANAKRQRAFSSTAKWTHLPGYRQQSFGSTARHGSLELHGRTAWVYPAHCQ